MSKMLYLPPDKIAPWVNYRESPQLDAIQNKKNIADCNVDSKNNNGFLFLETEITVFYSYLDNCLCSFH